MGMNDFTSIIGKEPNDIKYLYSISPNIYPEINYGSFSVGNYPNIKVWEIIPNIESSYDDKQLDRYQKCADDSHMGDLYNHYNAVEKVLGRIEVSEIINLPGHTMTIPERNSISGKTLYKMNDNTLKVAYFTGDLYYDIEDCKKVAINGMKKAFEFADETVLKIQKQIEEEKKLWKKPFSEYPHLIV